MMKYLVSGLCLVSVLLAAALPCAAAPAIARTPTAVTVTLDNGATLEFALHQGLLLGLRTAAVNGVALSNSRTVQRPILAQEWGDGRMIWPFLRLREAARVGNRVELRCDLLGTTDERAFREAFVFKGNPEKALADGMTFELSTLSERAKAGQTKIDAALAGVEAVKTATAELAKVRIEADMAGGKEKKALLARASALENQLAAVKARELAPLVAQSADLREAQADVAAFAAAAEQRAMEVGDIHRDAYGFAHLQQPEAACDIDTLTAQADALSKSLQPAGRLTWVIEPDSRNIAGWSWQGWKQHYAFTLDGGRKVNVLRQLGTWEIDGQALGLTAVNLRYRGLGRIEQVLAPTADGAGVKSAWSTTEIMPGAVGGAYLVSPQVPESKGVDFADRGYALQHRIGSWIVHPARGAGHGFVDFQYRPQAAFCSFYERQGNLRALTETFPGDHCLSQTDEEFFAQTGKFSTQPQVYLALVTKDAPLTVDESRTRWQEVDQYVRDLVSDELHFVQYDVEPSVGVLWDGGFGGAIKQLAGKVDGWSAKGVRSIILHNPGWVNGRSVRAKQEGTENTQWSGGGVCNVYDWRPLPTAEAPWKELSQALARNKVSYYIWLTGMSVYGGDFAQAIGPDPTHWARNAPVGAPNDTYGIYMVKHNIMDAKFRQVFLDRLEALRRDYGYQGFWADSFQNLFMSQLDWANTGSSQQRAWWEQIAAWSREGVGWMAESHAFPGQSCSIEVTDWEKDYWFFPHVNKWYRGNSQRDYTPEQLDTELFRVMANKGWTTPDGSPDVIPSFTRMAKEYSTALPAMRRPYILGAERGVLWLPFSDSRHGIWFSFTAQDVPAGVKAAYLLDEAGAAVTRTQGQHTYRVDADNLLRAFGVRAGTLPDPRIGKPYATPAYTWPSWADRGN